MGVNIYNRNVKVIVCKRLGLSFHLQKKRYHTKTLFKIPESWNTSRKSIRRSLALHVGLPAYTLSCQNISLVSERFFFVIFSWICPIVGLQWPLRDISILRTKGNHLSMSIRFYCSEIILAKVEAHIFI